VTGNDWKAPVPAYYSTINFYLFGSVWGQKVGAASSNLKGQWDFYFANGFLYVYSVGNPASAYGTAIVPMALSNVPVINVNGKSWLTFQHLLVNWFDQYGVYVQGTSDHLVFANMEADSMIPQGAQPLGFYVNESAPGPGDIKIYNSESHMNYDAFRFDGAATAIAMVNDKAYGNRDAALVDNTGAVNYSYCHFYASSLAVAGSTDVLSTSGPGPTAGAGNIAADTAPAVQAWQRYPAQVTLTVDDAGMTVGTDTYYASTVLPIANAAGVPVGVAITVGVSAGPDVDSGISRMGECGTRRDAALDLAHLLHQYGRHRYSIYGDGVGGGVEYQQPDTDDHSDRSSGHRELQPGTGTGHGDDCGIRCGTDGDGTLRSFGESGVPGSVRDGVLVLHEDGVVVTGPGGCEFAGREERNLSSAIGCDAADDG
jgi:hypothetical protein